MPRMKTVNIHDVARIAGVGVGTVSRVLNGGAHVKRSTFVRVSAVIQRLKFRPNAQARRIQRRRSEMVCFILSNRPFSTLCMLPFCRVPKHVPERETITWCLLWSITAKACLQTRFHFPRS